MKKARALAHRPPLFLRAAALLLLLALPSSLVSCGGAPPIVTEGLTVLEEPSTPPSAEAVAAAAEVLSALFLYAAEKQLGGPVPSGMREKISAHAEEAAALLAGTGVDEEGYLALTAILSRDGEGAITEWIEGSDAGYPCLRALYLSLRAYLSAERLAGLAYFLLLYSYDVRCDTAKQRFETYGYPHLKLEYDALVAERNALLLEIGEESFSAALRSLLMLSDLFAGAEGDAAALSSFTPTELRIVLRYIPLDEIRVSATGFAVLLRLAAKSARGPGGRLLAAAEESGDLSLLAAKGEGMLTLLLHLRDAVGEEEAALLQAGEHDALLSALFAALPDEDWELLASLAALPLDRAAYDGVATAEWGAAYTAYAASILPISADELRAAVGSDGFSALLLRYLASLSPALPYLLERQ